MNFRDYFILILGLFLMKMEGHEESRLVSHLSVENGSDGRRNLTKEGDM